MKFISLSDTIYDYAQQQRTPDDELFAQLRQRTHDLGEISEMLIPPDQGTLLSILIAATGVKRAIEIGTFTGMSSLYIARALPTDGTLLCCDVSEEWTSIAREYWQRGGVADKVELRIAPALETLNALENETFDFAFIDADKGNYDNYYEAILPRLRDNSLIIFDNMLRRGRLAHPEQHNEDDKVLDALNRKLAHDERVESVLLTIGDGLNIVRKRAD